MLRLVQNSLQDVGLTLPSGHERHPGSMVYHGVSQRDPLGRGLRGILDVRYPPVLLGQQFVARKEGGGVAVWTRAQENEVEDGETSAVAPRELADELFLVRVAELFEVVEEGRVDGMDVLLRDGDFGVQFVLAEEMVGVVVVERDYAFISVEDLPKQHRGNSAT